MFIIATILTMYEASYTLIFINVYSSILTFPSTEMQAPWEQDCWLSQVPWTGHLEQNRHSTNISWANKGTWSFTGKHINSSHWFYSKVGNAHVADVERKKYHMRHENSQRHWGCLGEEGRIEKTDGGLSFHGVLESLSESVPDWDLDLVGTLPL